ncbi:ABC transporter substrate-binding protein [Streptomyces sp. NPDC026673]|uniref:ABC transporter substrate-binding protein n=1 Tax=Streptomyces sp. NPDC026673 TaxID=3155724 RepID=UPI0033D04396
MKSELFVLPAVLCLAIPALSGCGGVDGSAGGEDGVIVIGTTDRFAVSKDFSSPVDPATGYDGASWTIFNNTFQMLLSYSRGSTRPQPDAAKTCGFSDAKSRVYRCTLRDGLTFSNGDALTARDVKFSVDRLLKIKSDFGPHSLLANVDIVETPDDKTVVFHLKGSDATFPFKLATPAAAIVDSKVYEPSKPHDGFDIVGSGPYKLDSWTKEKAVFSANTGYKGTFKRNNDKVELRFFADAEKLKQALADGDVDVVTRTLTPEQITEIRKGSVPGVELTGTIGAATRYLFFNVEDPSVKSPAVREAIARVVDRGALIRDVLSRTADPLFGVVGTGIPGHSNAYFNRYNNDDHEKAARTLADAGIRTPVKLSFTYPTDRPSSPNKAEAEHLAKQLNDSGLFDVDLHGVPWDTFQPGVASGKWAMYSLGWLPDFPDADNYIAPFFAEGFLDLNYKDDQIKPRLLPRTRESADRRAAEKTFLRMQEILAEDLPVIPLYQEKQYVAAREGVTGTEWALNFSSSTLFWELARGASR